MAKSLNKCMFIGNLTRDVESKFLPNGDAVCNFSIACNESWKDRNTGEKVEKVEFINVVAFRKLAEICGKWLNKGSKVYVEGKYQTRKWEKDGVTHYSTEVLIHDMQMLGAISEGGGQQQSSAHQSRPEADPAPAPADNTFDDDIPF